MNTLHVTPGFYPAVVYGGPARSTYEVAVEQARRGHNITVFTSNLYLEDKVEANQPQDVDGITTFYFDYSRFWRKLEPHFVVVPKMKTIAKKMFRAGLFDLVHFHEMRNYFTPVISKLCRQYKVPYVVTPHGTLYPRGVSVFKKKLFDALYGKRILENAAMVIALAEMEKRELQQMFSLPPEKIKIVPNGVNLEQFRGMPPRGMLRKKFGIKSNAKVVLFLSRINKMKGLDLLIKAFALLRQRSAVLVVAGNFEGSEKRYPDEIKKLVSILGLQNRIIFTGPVSGKDRLAAYGAADIFVLPSRYEPFGLVLLEAMACSLPVITTEKCGIAPVLESEKAAVVVPFDEKQLALAIDKLLADGSTREKLVENGKKLAEQFSWKKNVDAMEGVYERAHSAKNL